MKLVDIIKEIEINRPNKSIKDIVDVWMKELENDDNIIMNDIYPILKKFGWNWTNNVWNSRDIGGKNTDEDSVEDSFLATLSQSQLNTVYDELKKIANGNINELEIKNPNKSREDISQLFDELFSMDVHDDIYDYRFNKVWDTLDGFYRAGSLPKVLEKLNQTELNSLYKKLLVIKDNISK